MLIAQMDAAATPLTTMTSEIAELEAGIAKVQATDAALTTSVDVLQSTGPIAYTALTAGKRIHLSPPAAGLTKRYWGLRYVVAGATTTAGTVTASLVRNVDTGLAT